MGWFDDDDDDSDDEGKAKSFKLATYLSNNETTTSSTKINNEKLTFDHISTNHVRPVDDDSNHVNENHIEENANYDDSDDPLDLYMSTIDHQLQESTATNTTPSNRDPHDESIQTQPRGERLDVENEEEATLHWIRRSSEKQTWSSTNPNQSIQSTSRQENYNDDNDEEEEEDAKEAISNIKLPKHSLVSSSFHKAGCNTSRKVPTLDTNMMSTTAHNGKKSKQSQNNKRDGDHEEDDDVSTTSDPNLSMDDIERHYDIEPLEKCNHTIKQYAQFRKCFYKPTCTESGVLWRKEHDVVCSIDTIDPILSFSDLGPNDDDNDDYDSSKKKNQSILLPSQVLEYLENHGYKEPTLVQAQCIPLALAGKDLLVTSPTGSGKTLGYAIPLLVHVIDQPLIQPGIDGPIAIILTPTRELARQVFLVCKKILKLVDATAYAVTGGMGTYEMTKDLKRGCEVVISTPGRWIDMVKKKASNFDRTTLVVLDEADKMLDMGFESQVGSILDNIRPDRQSWMFSATFGRKVERVAKRWLKDPVRVAIGRTGTSSEHVSQTVIVLPSYNMKKEWMKQMLPILADIGRMIIFVSSRADCEEIAQDMKNSPYIGGKGILIGSLHGDKHQSDRNATLAAFRKGTISTLVATDVASRGLDVTDVMTVINFDAAKNLDSHIHRIGRCGRLRTSSDPLSSQEHKKGNAYTILTPTDADFANILLESFMREGREVSDEMMQLASKSRHFGGGGRRQLWNKSGLGYADDDDPKIVNQWSVGDSFNQAKSSSKKRHRWDS